MTRQFENCAFVAYSRKRDPVYAMRVFNAKSLTRAFEAGAPVHASHDGLSLWSVQTAHGLIAATWGDYLATDGKGDWWPVKADIFHERYEPAINALDAASAGHEKRGSDAAGSGDGTGIRWTRFWD